MHADGNSEFKDVMEMVMRLPIYPGDDQLPPRQERTHVGRLNADSCGTLGQVRGEAALRRTASKALDRGSAESTTEQRDKSHSAQSLQLLGRTLTDGVARAAAELTADCSGTIQRP